MASPAPHPGLALAEGEPAMIRVLRYQLPGPGVEKLRPRGARPIEMELAHQLELLDRWGFTLITFEDYRLFMKGDLHLPRKPIILTFDDCIHRVYQTVLPVLRDDGARAVVFAVTGKSAPVAMQPGRRQAGDLPFDPDHLAALHESGCEIGSLTCTNRPLPFLTPGAVEQELTVSKKILEDLLGGPVFSLAYPSDLVNPEIKRLVMQAGFEFAVSGSAGSHLIETEPYEIRRHTIRVTTGTLSLALSAFAPDASFERLRLLSFSRFGRDSGTLSSRTAL